MTNGFKVGDKVKWVDPDNDSEMLFGEVADWFVRPGFTSVVYDSDTPGLPWLLHVKTADLHHAGDELADCKRYYDLDDDPIVVPPEKKGYEPDGFNLEAFDDFMRNL